MHALTQLVFAQVCAHADFSLLPNAQGLFGTILNFVYGSALVAAAGWTILGIVQGVAGSRNNNFAWAESGRHRALIGFGSTILIAATPAIINALETLGRTTFGSC